MSVPKAKALLTVCAALLLCGCGQALSEREIVRAVFFARQQGAYSACLLLADQNAESDGVQYKTASARGDTAAQALHLGEEAVHGGSTTGCSTWPHCRRAVIGPTRRHLARCSTTRPSPRRSFRFLCWTPPTTVGPRTRPPCMRT